LGSVLALRVRRASADLTLILAMSCAAIYRTGVAPSDICSFATCMPRTGSGTTRRSSRRWKTYYCTGALAHRVGRLRKTSQLLSRCLSESCGAAWRAHDNVMIERSMSGMQQSASHSESRVEQ